MSFAGKISEIGDVGENKPCQKNADARDDTPKGQDIPPQLDAPELQPRGLTDIGPEMVITRKGQFGEMSLPGQEHVKAELRDLTSAVRRRWTVPRDALDAALAMSTQIIADPRTPRRTRITAAKFISTMARMDLEDLHHRERLDAEQGIVRLKMERAEQGLANDLVAISPTGSQQLPLPPYLAGKARALTYEPTDEKGRGTGERDGETGVRGRPKDGTRKDASTSTTSGTPTPPTADTNAPG